MTERCGVVLKENPLISIHTSGSFKKKYFSLRPPTEGDVQGVSELLLNLVHWEFIMDSNMQI